MLNCIFTALAGARRDGAVIISVMSGRLKTKGKRTKNNNDRKKICSKRFAKKQTPDLLVYITIE